MKLRKLTTVLCFSMVVGLLAGCGTTASSTKNSVKNTEVSSEDTTETSEQTEDSEQQDLQTEESEQKEPQTEGSEQEEPETEVNNPVETESKEEEEALTKARLEIELQRTEGKVTILEEQLEGAMNQTEMNDFSAQIYQTWDDILNVLWDQTEKTLEKEEFEKLRREQEAWISEKERRMEAAGEEYEGGSMRPMVIWNCGAELTRERVYKLADILKEHLEE